MDKGPELGVPQENGIKWDYFPKATARAYQGVLEELSTSTFDRDPDQAQKLHDKVEGVIKDASRGVGSDFSTPNNREIARYFEDLAEETAQTKKDPDLVPELELLADIARALYKPRR